MLDLNFLGPGPALKLSDPNRAQAYNFSNWVGFGTRTKVEIQPRKKQDEQLKLPDFKKDCFS